MAGFVKHIPNTITSMNLLCGVLGILSCFSGEYLAAYCFMLAASVFDFCDGLAARLLKAYSPMGKELDSLSDMVSFGVLPALMLSVFVIEESGLSGAAAAVAACSPLLIAVFSGLRLAKFNVDDRQTDNFIGLATPASALMTGALVSYLSVSGRTWLTPSLIKICVPLLSLMLALLLVSEVPMFGMKIKRGVKLFSGLYGRMRLAFFIVSVIVAAVVIVCGLHFTVAFFLIFMSYIIINLIAYPWTKLK